MVQRLALFDFDGTLCRGNSYHLLLVDLLRGSPRSFLRIAPPFAVRQLRLIPGPVLKNAVLAEFRGWSRAKLADFGRTFYARRLRPRLMTKAIAEMEKLRTEGFVLVIVSGAFEFLLAPFCAEYRISLCAGTQLAFAGDTCLGRLAEEEMRGEGKRRFLQTQFAAQAVDWQASYAFSDELSDLPLFEMVGHRFLVNGKSSIKDSHPDIHPVVW